MAVSVNSAIELAMEYGGVQRVRDFLADEAYLKTVSSRPDGDAIIGEARPWLAQAMAYEAEHGVGSKLDRNHWHLKQMERLCYMEREQDAAVSRQQRAVTA